jgi:hypothetical protein
MDYLAENFLGIAGPSVAQARRSAGLDACCDASSMPPEQRVDLQRFVRKHLWFLGYLRTKEGINALPLHRCSAAK